MSILSERRTIREFSDEPITQEELETFIKLAQNAPSAVNTQPGNFYILNGKERVRELAEKFIIPDNMQGFIQSRKSGEFAKVEPILCDAPAVVFLTLKNSYGPTFDGVDSGIIISYLLLAAHEMGWGAMPVGMIAFSKDPICEYCQIPDDETFIPVCVAFGKKAEKINSHEKAITSNVHYV
eukprot:TRINITY_DN39_c0_g1_i1.p1 TRINITY_DN39_c0_g1~~TRINITY_DN39_c0_g1_i1.p1  ORF type:complete len:181 (+),score=50.18 TRINITY_DN39_c0_g1_i1:93-635(+)